MSDVRTRNRLPWRRTLLALGLVLTAGCGSRAPERVILIVVDTLRADHLGLYGYERATSPELDSWARRGLVLDFAFSTSPWTLPTFGSILTGRPPSQHGAGERTRESGKRWKRAPLLGSVATLPETLAERDWQTAAVVSNPFLREHFGLARGFQIYDYERGRNAGKVIDRSLELVDELASRPFLLMVHLIDPHLPYRAPEPWRGKFSADSAGGDTGKSRKEIMDRLSELTTAEQQQIIDRYDEEVAYVDHELGRFLNELETRGLMETSLVLLTSDHGEELFDRGSFEHGHSMHQELLRVPLIVWDASLEPGRRTEPFSLADLPQTLFVATQNETSPSLRGTSRWQELLDRQSGGRPALIAENTLWSAEQKVLVTWPYKLITHEKTGRRELYDLASDPHELRDLAAEESELVAALERELQDRLAQPDAKANRESMVISEETEEELRSLGYLD